jgi:hypothetical protein
MVSHKVNLKILRFWNEGIAKEVESLSKKKSSSTPSTTKKKLRRLK